MGGRTRKSINESLDLDPKGSPHKEEGLIGGVADLEILSLFLKWEQESLEGWRDSKLKEGQQWRRESCKRVGVIGEEAPLK